MFVRFHLLELAAAPTAKLFAIRHSQGQLVRDGDGAVVIGSDVVELDKRRRALNVATVAHIVALVPESDVQHGEGAPLVPDALVGPLAALLDVGQQALARYVSPPTLDELRELAHGMGFVLKPRLPTVPSLDEVRELLGRMRAEPDAPQPDSSADVEREPATQAPEAAASLADEEPLPDAPTTAELALAAQAKVEAVLDIQPEPSKTRGRKKS